MNSTHYSLSVLKVSLNPTQTINRSILNEITVFQDRTTVLRNIVMTHTSSAVIAARS